MYTYKQLKDEVFKLIYAYSKKGKISYNDAGNKDAMLGIPEATNFAMVDIQDVCPKISQYSVIQSPPPLCVSVSEGLKAFFAYQHTNTDIVKEFRNAKAYYFEVEGSATIEIQSADGLLLETIINTKRGVYTSYKKHTRYMEHEFSEKYIDYPNIKIVFKGKNLYNFRNVMCYSVAFGEDAEIMPYKDYLVYDLRRLINNELGYDGFLRLDKDNPITMRGEFGGYDENYPYFLQGSDKLILNYFDCGEVTVNYISNPVLIDANTPDDFDLETQLPVHALRIIPYYIAYRVGLEEDEEVATSYYNLYSQKKAELKGGEIPMQKECFTSEVGF